MCRADPGKYGYLGTAWTGTSSDLDGFATALEQARRVLEEMTSEPSADRHYTEKEVHAILQRAAQLQEARTPGADGAAGTTLAQLQQAASELGLDAGLIAQAAGEVETGAAATTRGSWLLGGPWKVEYDQLLPGTVTEENWPFVVDELRAATGRVGTPQTVGKGFEWLSKSPDPMHVTFTPHGPDTRVRLTARFGDWGVLFFFPSILGTVLTAIVGAALTLSGKMPPGLFLALLSGIPVLPFLAGRVGFGKLCARRRDQVRNVIERLKRALRESGQQTTEAAPQVEETQRAVTSYASAAQPSEGSQLIAQMDRRSG